MLKHNIQKPSNILLLSLAGIVEENAFAAGKWFGTDSPLPMLKYILCSCSDIFFSFF